MAGHTLKRRLWRWTPGAFVGAFALALALFGGPAYAEPDNVHEAVYHWAAEHPGQNVPVIVHTDGDSARADSAVSAYGGEVKANFDFISSVQAEIPAAYLRNFANADGVGFVSLDAPVFSANSDYTDNLRSAYPYAIDADDAWNEGVFGTGVGVAIVDTGISPTTNPDFTMSGQTRVIASFASNSLATSTNDGYGHGTHIAGIVGSDGDLGGGRYVGIAPRSKLVNVKIADDVGGSSLGDLIAGLQWVYSNKSTYNIRVLNLSLHSSIPESYKTSPLDAAVEFLWKNGVFVVVASGNTGAVPGAVNYPPANDPFVMTIGAFDDRGTNGTGDDIVASFTSRGVTQDGFTKPEMYTPGVNIVSDTDTSSILYAMGFAQGKVVTPGPYLKMSGTSMAAGVMSGVAALDFEKHPNWTPGQMKCTMLAKARTLNGPNPTIKVPRARETYKQNTPSCNSDYGLTPSRGLAAPFVVPFVGAVAYVLSQPDPYAAAAEIGLDITEANLVTTSPNDPTVALSIETVDWSVIKWDVIKWDLIKWDLIKWDSIKWDSIKWDLIKWDSIKWDLIKWDSIKWDLIKWDLIKWDLIKWDSIKWDSIKWDSIKWDSIKWDSVKWDSIGFDSVSGQFEDNPTDNGDGSDSSTPEADDTSSDAEQAVSLDGAAPTTDTTTPDPIPTS
jgi:serine protease AprX